MGGDPAVQPNTRKPNTRKSNQSSPAKNSLSGGSQWNTHIRTVCWNPTSQAVEKLSAARPFDATHRPAKKR